MQKGFSLIEIMVVIAIIGILAYIGIPAYQDYMIRSRIIDGLNILQSYKVPIAEYYNINGSLPTASNQFMDPNPILSEYMDSISYDFTASKTWIYLSFKGDAMGEVAGKKVALVAETSLVRDGIVWTCTTHATDTINYKYMPKSCKSFTEYMGG